MNTSLLRGAAIVLGIVAVEMALAYWWLVWGPFPEDALSNLFD